MMCDPALQMDKTWSAQASRPYDPYLTPKGEEQVIDGGSGGGGGGAKGVGRFVSILPTLTWSCLSMQQHDKVNIQHQSLMQNCSHLVYPSSHAPCVCRNADTGQSCAKDGKVGLAKVSRWHA